MLTHDNLMFNARLFNEVDPRYDTDNHLSFLPLGWIAEHALGIAPHCNSGLIMNFPEEPETVRENLREIAPQGVLYNSRLWENLVATVQVKMNDASWINRKLYDLFLPVGYRYADRKYGPKAWASRSGWSTSWAICWSFARCATKWASSTCVRPIPAALP